MRKLLIVLVPSLALIGACAAPADLSPPAAETRAMVPTVYVIRHMEKQSGDDPLLSDVGAANAQRLAAILADKGVVAIFVTATRRSRLTGEPLATATGVQLVTYDPKDNAALVAKVSAIPGSVLVVGHSNTVPGLVAAFGGKAPGPMDESDYGRLFAIRRVDGATVETRLHN